MKIRYLLTNENAFPNPPLGWVIGSKGFITRESPTTGLIPVYSVHEQNFPDIFASRIHNYNTQKRIDEEFSELIQYGLKTVRIPLQTPGRAQLPTQPYGDIVLGVVMLHLNDGIVVELTGATLSFYDDHWWVTLEPEDYDAYQLLATELTLTYLCDLNDVPTTGNGDWIDQGEI